MTQPFLIANMEVGLERDREPWLLPDEAFPTLEDAYLFRGRIKRRNGYRNLGRLITTVGVVDTINNLPVMGLRTRELTTRNQEQLIAFDTRKANVYSTTNEAFQDISFYTLPATNAFSWTGTDVDFFWTTNYANAFWVTNFVSGNQPTWNMSAGTGDGIRWYDGSNWANFMPAINGARGAVGTTYLRGCLLIVSYRNRLVTLNTYEGIDGGGVTNFPQRARWCQNGTPFNQNDVNGNVITNPGGVTGDDESWNDDIIGKGGYIDAPTSEEIVSAAFIHDTLIVFFERSTWELTYTGDPILPFIWKRINTELGAESTFSAVPFDQGLLGVGNYGITTANNNGVQRIDQKIPDEVFKIHNGNDGVKRVYGIRDYARQLVYWTFPNALKDPIYPTRVLVFDYLEGTYAIFNDSLTCFGQYQPFDDTTWADLPEPWDGTDSPWNDAKYQSGFPSIVAGNQQGFVFFDYNNGEIINDPSLRITAISQANPAVVSSPNHNLSEGTIISISDLTGMSLVVAGEGLGSAPIGATSFTGNTANTPLLPGSITVTVGANVFTDDGNGNFTGGLGGTVHYSSGYLTVNFTALASLTGVTIDYTAAINNGIFAVANPTTNTFELQNLDNNDNLVNTNSTPLSAYVSGGLIRVRNNINILTKKFNPFINGGSQSRIRQIDYFVEFTQGLEFTTEVFLDENNNESVQVVIILPETNTLSKVWVPAYYSAIGQFNQINVRFSDSQMFIPLKSNGDITIHAFMLYMQPAGRLTYGHII